MFHSLIDLILIVGNPNEMGHGYIIKMEFQCKSQGLVYDAVHIQEHHIGLFGQDLIHGSLSGRGRFQRMEAFQILKGFFNFAYGVPVGIYDQVMFQVPEVKGFKLFIWTMETVDDCYKNYI